MFMMFQKMATDPNMFMKMMTSSTKMKEPDGE